MAHGPAACPEVPLSHDFVARPAVLPRLPGRRLILFTVWLALSAQALLASPSLRPETLDLLWSLFGPPGPSVDPGVYAVFNLLGAWPMMYASVLLADGAGRRLVAWPFVVGAFFSGAFAVLPYLALRGDHTDFRGQRRGFVWFFDTRAFGVFVALFSLGLIVHGLGVDPDAYRALFHADKLVHIMSIDLCVLSLAFPVVLGDDMARRGLRSRTLFWAVACVPVVGPALYIALRPRLPLGQGSGIPRRPGG